MALMALLGALAVAYRGILLLLTFASISHFGYLMEVLEWQVSLFQNRTHKRKQDRRIARIRTVNIASSYAGHMSS